MERATLFLRLGFLILSFLPLVASAQPAKPLIITLSHLDSNKIAEDPALTLLSSDSIEVFSSDESGFLDQYRRHRLFLEARTSSLGLYECPERPASFRDLVRTAGQQIDIGSYQEASETLDTALKQFPCNQEAIPSTSLARFYYHKGVIDLNEGKPSTPHFADALAISRILKPTDNAEPTVVRAFDDAFRALANRSRCLIQYPSTDLAGLRLRVDGLEVKDNSAILDSGSHFLQLVDSEGNAVSGAMLVALGSPKNPLNWPPEGLRPMESEAARSQIQQVIREHRSDPALEAAINQVQASAKRPYVLLVAAVDEKSASGLMFRPGMYPAAMTFLLAPTDSILSKAKPSENPSRKHSEKSDSQPTQNADSATAQPPNSTEKPTGNRSEKSDSPDANSITANPAASSGPKLPKKDEITQPEPKIDPPDFAQMKKNFRVPLAIGTGSALVAAFSGFKWFQLCKLYDARCTDDPTEVSSSAEQGEIEDATRRCSIITGTALGWTALTWATAAVKHHQYERAKVKSEPTKPQALRLEATPHSLAVVWERRF